MSLTILVLLIVGAALLLLTALALGFVALIWHILDTTGSFARLVERYPLPSSLAGECYRRETVQVGAVRWRRSVTVTIASQGLGIAIQRPLMAARAVLIPWEQIVAVERAHLYWQRARRMSVGRPALATITVRQELYERIAPHLLLRDVA